MCLHGCCINHWIRLKLVRPPELLPPEPHRPHNTEHFLPLRGPHFAASVLQTTVTFICPLSQLSLHHCVRPQLFLPSKASSEQSESKLHRRALAYHDSIYPATAPRYNKTKSTVITLQAGQFSVYFISCGVDPIFPCLLAREHQLTQL